MNITHNGVSYPVNNSQAKAIILYLAGFDSLSAEPKSEKQEKRVYKKRKGVKHSWTEEETRQMFHWKDSMGKTYKWIGKQIGVSEKAVQQRYFQQKKKAPVKPFLPSVLDKVAEVEKEKVNFGV